MEVLLPALGGETRGGARAATRSARGRRPASRCSRTAARRVVEMAQASGLGLVRRSERDAEAASHARAPAS